MSYSTINFILFVLGTVLVYFLIPKKVRWTVLLAASVVFYIISGWKFAFYILFTAASTYLIALWIDKISRDSKEVLKKNKKEWSRDDKKQYKNKIKIRKRLVMALALVAWRTSAYSRF